MWWSSRWFLKRFKREPCKTITFYPRRSSGEMILNSSGPHLRTLVPEHTSYVLWLELQQFYVLLVPTLSICRMAQFFATRPLFRRCAQYSWLDSAVSQWDAAVHDATTSLIGLTSLFKHNFQFCILSLRFRLDGTYSMTSKQSIPWESTQIEKVIVFPDRAEIQRKIPLKLEGGVNEIILEVEYYSFIRKRNFRMFLQDFWKIRWEFLEVEMLWFMRWKSDGRNS